MKKLYITVFGIALLTSCGGGGGKKSVENIIESGSLEAMKTKRGELVMQRDELSGKLTQLDEAIAKLDTLHKLALVSATEAKDTLFNHYIELQGNVSTKQNILINAEYNGILTQVYVKEGQAVRKGQLLAKIDDGGLSQQLAQLEIQANLAKTTYERQKRLWDQNIGSEMQFLDARTSYESQEKAIAQLKDQIAKTTVTAPFSGTIDDVITDQGTAVTPGNPLMRIVSLNNMYIEAEVPEKYLASIKKGTDVEIDFPVLGKTVDAKVRQVGNYINPNNRSFKIEVDVPNDSGNIKPNLTAKLRVNDYTSEHAILIPQSIISENANGEQYVYIAEKNGKKDQAIAKRVIIQTGKPQGDIMEVLEGISAGDHLINEGARSVEEGQVVKIIK
ncbi:efflux RND transporter periplasmic adaptor subunit [Sinomicrobium weinanense]|uniref:Efflux RND transporter periplasmic adaptor subunit n=1 Tax=Sinomicrobium weinanense TaxID=2842200 RepID=A0A926JPG2_9FLAO|nr:efflux RND transporter periplasmic adaptor subunit [Sinomicrobium weinanense]MBC9794909.1 efflux RND transporter periplasmic adaptor subunit [Sinomicrobium weinanense]MBU3125680.1 efflux RND transporter periplasmic adaptor subunit [Sinomicrobium weinanense]